MSKAYRKVGLTSLLSVTDPMIIAGGVYVEKCVVPGTVQLLGSGGRAALALSSLRSSISLHTFQPEEFWADLTANFAPVGIKCVPYQSRDRITFSYLFPLGRPSHTPAVVERAPGVLVAGKEVLSFGCLEGDFIIEADAAVYDPQGRISGGFRLSGSRAKRLAVVLNAGEAMWLSGKPSIREAGLDLLHREQAQAIVIKDGPNGALIVTDTDTATVPAYESRSLYKIGSGDIFTAMFAHSWLCGHAPADAADQASRHTAAYVESPNLPLTNSIVNRQPRRSASTSEVVIIGGQRTLSERWLCAVAAEAIEYLGVTVTDVLDRELWSHQPHPLNEEFAGVRLLILARDQEQAGILVAKAQVQGIDPIAFLDCLPGAVDRASPEGFYEDLSQALYELCWTRD